MYLNIIGQMFSKNLYKELELITNKALIDMDDFEYKEDCKEVCVTISRLNINKIKDGFLGVLPIIEYDPNVLIRSRIRIRNVVNYNVESVFDGDICDKKFRVLFGFVIKDNQIFISSAEENRGKPVVLVQITVSGIDVELADSSG